jgi:glycosidase
MYQSSPALRRRPRILVLLLLARAALAQPASLPDSPALDDVFYQFMPIAWRDSDNDSITTPDGQELKIRFGDFRAMTDSLDYLSWLGVTAVWMTPIVPSPAYHGYQHLAADAVNPRLGTEKDFRDFVRAAHARSIKVYIDLVTYGINQDSPWFNDAHNNPASRFDSWLAFADDANAKYRGYTFRTWDGSTVGFVHWDLRSPGPRGLVTSWARKWITPSAPGADDAVDGFRLDHVWAKYENGPDGWGYNIDDFWIPWKRALRDANPQVFVFAEQARWETTGVDLLAASSGEPAFDAAFTKPFEFAARDALATARAGPLYKATSEALAALASLPKDSRATFLAILGDHDVDRLASHLKGDMQRSKLAAAILVLQPFPPIIYMGDEIGMLGIRQKYGSDANDIPVREPFKWKAIAGPPMTNYWALNEQCVKGAFSKDGDGRSVEEQQGVHGSLLEEYRRLIALRRSTPALRRGTYKPVESSDGCIWAFERAHAGERLLAVFNLSDKTVVAHLVPPGAGAVARFEDLDPATAQGPVVKRDDAAGVPLSPHSWRLLRLER